MELTTEDGKTSLTIGEDTYTDLSAVSVTLQKAAVNSSIVELDAEWANFRGADSNNGITNAKTPISAAGGMLYWASPLGKGWDNGAVSSPILVDDCLVVYAGSKIYRVSKATGKVEAEGNMAGTSSFAINGPTYAERHLAGRFVHGRFGVQRQNAGLPVAVHRPDGRPAELPDHDSGATTPIPASGTAKRWAAALYASA